MVQLHQHLGLVGFGRAGHGEPGLLLRLSHQGRLSRPATSAGQNLGGSGYQHAKAPLDTELQPLQLGLGWVAIGCAHIVGQWRQYRTVFKAHAGVAKEELVFQ
jgi:hypothetical protein